MVRARRFFRHYQNQQAVKSLYKTLELNPNLPTPAQWLGNYLLQQDEYEKAIDYLLKAATVSMGETDDSDFDQTMGFYLGDLDKKQPYHHFLKAIEINPENALLYEALSNRSMYFKEYDRMIEYAMEYRKLRPDLVNADNGLASAYMWAGRYEESEQVYEEMLHATSEFASTYMVYPFKHRLGYAKMMNGKEAEGRKILESHRDTLLNAIQLQEVNSSGNGDYYDLALIYAVLSQKEEALNYLREARDHEKEGAFYRLDFLQSDPMLDNLREEPEFREMLEAKVKEQEEITRIFHEKLKEYHARKELKWMKEV